VLVALFGPTSSGKTALSVELAQRIERDLGRPVVIVSADSRQVYRYLDIGTSKTTRAEMGGIRHEMIDVVEPVRKLELEEYARLARPHLGLDGIALVVGGTGVYVKALLDGWTLDPVGKARDALRRDFPRSMAADAYAMLRRLDKTTRVHPNNYEAVINALAARMGGAAAAAGPASRAVSPRDCAVRSSHCCWSRRACSLPATVGKRMASSSSGSRRDRSGRVAGALAQAVAARRSAVRMGGRQYQAQPRRARADCTTRSCRASRCAGSGAGRSSRGGTGGGGAPDCAASARASSIPSSRAAYSDDGGAAPSAVMT